MKRENHLIAVAGATGDLGRRIIDHLLQRKANVRAIIRGDSDKRIVEMLISRGVQIAEVDYDDSSSLVAACLNATCVVSALSGLKEVIVDAQSNLLNAAVEARVPRFIPSDFCIDYRPLQPGLNRNLDFRREFADRLARSPIKATSVLNGMFTDLLTDGAPIILKKQRRIFFWGNANQKMDFTTMENTAEYTAGVALDDSCPRWLMIAGDVASINDVKNIASSTYKTEFKSLRPGGLRAFQTVIN